jgi:aspartate kinase
MIVMKFGGTSVQDAAAIGEALDIIKGRLSRKPVVVVSAMARVTDALLRVSKLAAERRFGDVVPALVELHRRHDETARKLLPEGKLLSETQFVIGQLFEELENLARSVATLGELTPRTQDAIASFGERLSSILVAAALREKGVDAELVDSREFIITDNHFTSAAPDMSETERRTREGLLLLLDAEKVPVAQGFIGSTIEGITTTIGRGGSDYSAALIGAALDAESIEIWTDVDGLMTADPRVVTDAKRIRVISFDEAAELSYFGAKVLHPNTVQPAIERRIPVHIYNTHNPSGEGTLIVAEAQLSNNLIKSIAFKRGVTILNVCSTRMLMLHGFLRSIFEVFDRHETSVDVVTTSEVSVSISVDNTDRVGAIVADLNRIAKVTVEKDKAIVCVVGDHLKVRPGVAARLFSAISPINVNMISQGASEINLTFVIDEAEVERAARLLHKEFFSDADPAVFD